MTYFIVYLEYHKTVATNGAKYETTWTIKPNSSWLGGEGTLEDFVVHWFPADTSMNQRSVICLWWRKFHGATLGSLATWSQSIALSRWAANISANISWWEKCHEAYCDSVRVCSHKNRHVKCSVTFMSLTVKENPTVKVVGPMGESRRQSIITLYNLTASCSLMTGTKEDHSLQVRGAWRKGWATKTGREGKMPKDSDKWDINSSSQDRASSQSKQKGSMQDRRVGEQCHVSRWLACTVFMYSAHGCC